MIQLQTYIAEALKETNVFKEAIGIFAILAIIAVIIAYIIKKVRKNCKK